MFFSSSCSTCMARGSQLHLVTGLEADGERLSCRLCGPARRFHRGIDLHQRQPRMIEEGPAGIGQLDAARAADKQLRADFIFEVPDLTAQRRLGRMQPSLRRHREAAFLCNGEKIPKVAQLHVAPHACEVCRQPTKSFPTTQ